MNNGINLISGKKQSFEQQEKIVKAFRRIAYGSLIVVALISVGLFAVNFFSPLPKLTDQEQATLQTLLAQKAKIAKLLLIRDRIQHIDGIFLQDTSLEKILSSVAQNTAGDMSIDSFGIGKDDVSLILTSPSLASVNSFIDYLNAQVAKKTLFKKVTISSLALDVKNGKYTLSVAATPL